MAALTADRNTVSLWKGRSIPLKVKASTRIRKGALVAVDATGFAIPAGDTAGHIVKGIATEDTDNSTGASGDKTVVVDTGVFLVDNNGTNPIVQATVGSNAQVQDDHTVRASGSVNSIVAGKVEFIDATSLQVAIFIG